jgi:hypothetical protein
MDHIVFFISNCVINYVGGKVIRYNMDIVFGVQYRNNSNCVFISAGTLYYYDSFKKVINYFFGIFRFQRIIVVFHIIINVGKSFL